MIFGNNSRCFINKVKTKSESAGTTDQTMRYVLEDCEKTKPEKDIKMVLDAMEQGIEIPWSIERVRERGRQRGVKDNNRKQRLKGDRKQY